MRISSKPNLWILSFATTLKAMTTKAVDVRPQVSRSRATPTSFEEPSILAMVLCDVSPAQQRNTDSLPDTSRGIEEIVVSTAMPLTFDRPVEEMLIIENHTPISRSTNRESPRETPF